jgi:hypothetical protein
MQIRLAEIEDPEAPRCPDHGFPMVLEDFDPAYKQGHYLCPVVGCRRVGHTGPSDHDIRYNESFWW